MSARHLTGFTLLELMVTLAILAILTAIAVPSFQTLLERNRLTNATNELLGALQLARSNAVTTRIVTRVCQSTNRTTCTTSDGNWASGWIVLEGLNLNQGPTRLIRIGPALHAPLVATHTAGVRQVVFDPAGNLRAPTATANIQIANNSDQRCIRIRTNGQVMTEPNACPF